MLRKTFDDGLRGFLREAQNLARFNHPNIVRINRFFAENGTGYFVMDFEQGVSLRSMLSQTQDRFSEKEIEAMLLPLCDGLKVLHDRGLIHRDIKPDNILIRLDGSPVLIDFGAAIDVAAIRDKEFRVVATPRYAPIEQFDLRFPQGPWIDIYALSAMLYEMIAGVPPPQALTRIDDDTMPPAVEVGRGFYSDRLLGLIDQGLSLDFRERPGGMGEYVSCLRVDNKVYLRAILSGLSEKSTQHFLNWARPNDGLYVDEFVAFVICFPIIDLAWRIGKGMASREIFMSFYGAVDCDSLEQCHKLMLAAGFRTHKRPLSLKSVEGRIEEYASTYLIDRLAEKWNYELTRQQCAKNCISPSASTDSEGFAALMEDVIDRTRGRVKKEFNKAFRRVEWYRVADGWEKRIRTQPL